MSSDKTCSLEKILGSLSAAIKLMDGQKADPGSPDAWLSVFDSEELREFIREVLTAYCPSDQSKDSLNSIFLIIHEWHESAIAISSPVLSSAFDISHPPKNTDIR